MLPAELVELQAVVLVKQLVELQVVPEQIVLVELVEPAAVLALRQVVKQAFRLPLLHDRQAWSCCRPPLR